MNKLILPLDVALTKFKHEMEKTKKTDMSFLQAFFNDAVVNEKQVSIINLILSDPNLYQDFLNTIPLSFPDNLDLELLKISIPESDVTTIMNYLISSPIKPYKVQNGSVLYVDEKSICKISSLRDFYSTVIARATKEIIIIDPIFDCEYFRITNAVSIIEEEIDKIHCKIFYKNDSTILNHIRNLLFRTVARTK